MKKRESAIEVADLLPVAHFGEELVIYIFSKEGDSTTSLAVQADFEKRQFGPVQPLDTFLELKSYEPIKDIDAQISYRQRILEEMSSEEIASMLGNFTQEYLLKNGNLKISENYNPTWEIK